jgi:hypothetical protein
MAAKLKVFTWSDGFHAFTVATTSRPKALEAWGSRQNLFASGLASQLTGGPDYDAALAAPGFVIERGLAVDIGKISKAPKCSKAPDEKRKNKAKAKIEDLEAQLEAIDTTHSEKLSAFDVAVAEIEADRVAAETAYDSKRKLVVRRLEAARQAV